MAFTVLRVNFSRFDGHWTIEEQRERRHHVLAEHRTQQRYQQLRPSYGKCRNQDAPALGNRALHDFHEFLHRLFERTVVMISISGLEEHRIGLMKRFVLPQDRYTARSQVS